MRYLNTVVVPAAQIIGFQLQYRKSMECGIWPLIIMALPVFSTDQLSPPGTDSSRSCVRLCRRDFVLHKYLLLISDICKRLAYERHLSTYPPSDRDRQYYSNRGYHNLRSGYRAGSENLILGLITSDSKLQF